MIVTEIDPKSLRAIEELRRRNRQALEATTPGESGFDDLIADATLKLRDAAEREAPELTGTLKSAHRGMLADAGQAQVFIDPAVRNPVLGGYPAEYGLVVHKRNPWLGRVVQLDVPQVMSETGAALFARLDQIYKGAA